MICEFVLAACALAILIVAAVFGAPGLAICAGLVFALLVYAGVGFIVENNSPGNPCFAWVIWLWNVFCVKWIYGSLRKIKKDKAMPALVLGAICLTVALLLSVINLFTAPKIADNKKKAEIKSLQEVLPEGTYFDPITLTEEYPDVITGGYKSDAGFVFKAEVKGYQPGLVIMIGVDNDGRIAGVKHTASKETFGVEGELNNAYTEKHDTQDSLEMILSASASKGAPMTASAYYKAVDAALEAALIASGKKVEDIYPGVESMQIDDNGNYVFVSYGDGYAGKIRLKVSIDTEGKIVSVETLSHNETDGYGADVLNNSAFHDQLIGKDNGTFSGVENTTGATAPVTINGYKEAIRNAFAAFEALVEEGGDQ